MHVQLQLRVTGMKLINMSACIRTSVACVATSVAVHLVTSRGWFKGQLYMLQDQH